MNRNYTKEMEISLEVEVKNVNITTNTHYKATMTTDDFSFKSIARFQKDMALINHNIKVFTKKKIPFRMAVTVTEIDLSEWEETKSSNLLSFNLWEFDGLNTFSEDESEQGVYLQPNTKYTPAHYDAWYEFTLESLPDVSGH